MLRDFFTLGLNNLKRRKLRSWLTMVGIFIGIAAVVSLISLGQGLQTAVTAQFSSLSTDKLTITNAETGYGPPGSTAIEKLNDHDVKVIERVRGVGKVIPRLVRVARVEYNKVAQSKYLGSMPEDKEQMQMIYDSFGIKTEEGRLLEKGDYGKVVLGSNIVKEEEFDKEIKIGKSIEIQGEEFEVIGILEKASTFTLNDVILMLEEDMKDILDIDDEIDLIVVQVANPKEIEDVAERIEIALRKDRGLKEGEEDFSVETPLEALEAVNTVIGSINVVVVGIALISLIVGGIGIANTMYTSVLERKTEIGTMKAIGARNSDILGIFLIESGLLGLIGGAIGVIMGMALSLSVAYFANDYFGRELIIVNISIPLIISAITFSFLVGVLSGSIPSIQASKLRPVEALRG
jgi:putative ABC transport system permease protein